MSKNHGRLQKVFKNLFVSEFIFVLLMSPFPSFANGSGLALQCEKPRKDIFAYHDGKAEITENWTDGSLIPSTWTVVGFDPKLLEAVFYKVSGPPNSVGLITIFEINFAKPAVVEHRIGPDLNISFEFQGCRRVK